MVSNLTAVHDLYQIVCPKIYEDFIQLYSARNLIPLYQNNNTLVEKYMILQRVEINRNFQDLETYNYKWL